MSYIDTQEKFAQQVSNSQGIIHKICRMYCDDKEHQKDLFQEILIQLWKSYPSFRGEAKFSTWMYRVALSVAIQDFRKEKKRQHLIFTTYEFKEVADTTQSASDERLKQLYQAIHQLDKVERAIIMLYLEGKANDEIAEIIGITQNNVRVKMTRIRKKIALKLNP